MSTSKIDKKNKKNKNKFIPVRDFEINTRNIWPISSEDYNTKEINYIESKESLLYFECENKTTLMVAFKHLLTENDNYVQLDVDKTGILIHLELRNHDYQMKLYASKFKKYMVSKPFRRILNIKDINDVLKVLDSKETIGIELFSCQYKTTTIRVTLSPNIKESVSEDIHFKLPNKMSLTNQTEDNKSYTKKIPNYIIILSADSFNAKLSNMIKITNTKKIKFIMLNDKLTIEGKSIDDKVYEAKYTVKNETLYISSKNKTLFKGIYYLKLLSQYSTLHKISKKFVKLYLTKDAPLIVEYNIGNLGVIQIFIKKYIEEQ